jgi:beta-phosphoglucomutase-like phosphatase (HAD superfamily)
MFGAGRFEVVVTGDEAPQRKPDPSVYHVALERLQISAAEALAVEDSRNGLVAAVGADIRCAVVVNAYTRDQDFSEAELVIDGFGAPDRPATVLRDPHGVTPPCWLGATVLARIADR